MKIKLLASILLPLLLVLGLKTCAFAETPEIPLESNIEEYIEELIAEPPLNPLGVTENNQKVKDQKKSNETLMTICLVIMIVSGLGVALIILSPLFHHKKKKNPIKF